MKVTDLTKILKDEIKTRSSTKVMHLLKRIRDIRKGYWPARISYLILKIRTLKVRTFQDKILYKITFDRNPMMSVFADKVSVRNYVSNTVGSQYLTSLYGVFENGKEVQRQNLPRNFALKASHGSGGVLLVSEKSDQSNSLPSRIASEPWGRFLVHPDALNWQDAINLMNCWMNSKFWNSTGHFPEWAYKSIPPRIIAEELLTFENGIPQDYRIFIFEGRCEYLELDSRWKNNSTRTMFDRNWNLIQAKRNLPGHMSFPPADPIPDKPECLSEMIEIAEALAQGMDHLRVDLYLIGRRIVFGELTNYHTSGLQIFEPKNFNTEFGINWDPRRHYSRSGLRLS